MGFNSLLLILLLLLLLYFQRERDENVFRERERDENEEGKGEMNMYDGRRSLLRSVFLLWSSFRFLYLALCVVYTNKSYILI